jgi:AraC-like DNA-binding protein
MNFHSTNIDILNNLVGLLDESKASVIQEKIDCFLHPKVSLFIPASGQCAYAITPNHTHPAYSFIYYFQSVSDFIMEGRHMSLDISNGKCLSAISPDIAHQEIKQDHFQSYIAILIDAEFFRAIVKQYAKPIPVYRGEAYTPHPELLGILRCFMLEASDNQNSELLDHLAFTIAHLVVRSVILDTAHTVPLYDRFEVDQAIAYMNSHFSEKITIEDLAERVNFSAGYFSKIFKSVTGDSPIDFLNEMRLQKARNMLMDSRKNITEIAIECGFNTSSYFSACFLEKYSMTPSAYRQNFQVQE